MQATSEDRNAEIVETTPEAEPETSESVCVSLPCDVQKQLEAVDWAQMDTLVGTVRNQAQLEECLRRKYYYVPVNQVPDEQFPIRYVAIYESKIGIRYFGTVIRCARVPRRQIPFPMMGNYGEELYYAFVVKSWEEQTPVQYCEEKIYKARFTHFFLLQHSTQTYELFCIHSSEQYRLMCGWKELLRCAAQEETQTSHASYVLSIEGYGAIRFQDGCLDAQNTEGLSICRVPLPAALQKPGETLRRMMHTLDSREEL